MSKVFALCLATLSLTTLSLTALPLLATPARAGDLTITIKDVRNDKGALSFGLYQETKDWPDGKPVRELDIPAQTGPVTYILRDVMPGRYAISGFHDENGNKIHDTTMLGMPKEGFFFSNDAKPRLSAPAFSACAFEVGDAPAAITLHVQYWSSTR